MSHEYACRQAQIARAFKLVADFLEAIVQLYTLAFFIMVSTILMNIIFGVIIDTFAELRARKVLDLLFLRCALSTSLHQEVGQARTCPTQRKQSRTCIMARIMQNGTQCRGIGQVLARAPHLDVFIFSLLRPHLAT